MGAISRYLDELYELRNECEAGAMTAQEYYDRVINVKGDLHRRMVRPHWISQARWPHLTSTSKLFPPANYPYRVVGVLCNSRFRIPRHHTTHDPSIDVPEELRNKDTPFEVRVKPFSALLQPHVGALFT